MAEVLGRITINNTEMLEVDGDPSINPGTPAVTGSIAFTIISNEGRFFSKVGPLDVDWKEIVVKGTSNHFPIPKNYLFNMAPDYVNSHSIVVQHGQCSDSTNTMVIRTEDNITVSLNTSGIGGLDTGTKQPNQWYYVWIISNDSGSQVNAIFSLSRTNPTMPNGYTKKRVLRAAFRTDGSSNIIPFTIGAGWPHHPEFYYETEFDGSITTPTTLLHNVSATDFTDLNCSNFVPPTSARGIFYIWFNSNSRDAFFRENGSTSNGIRFRSVKNPSMYSDVFLNLDDNQILEYKTSTTTNLHLSVRGFVITQEH